MKMRKMMGLIGAVFAAINGFAQDPGQGAAADAPAAPAVQAPASDAGLPFLDSSPEAMGAFANNASTQAQKYVQDKGWSIGVNPDGRFVAVGEGTIQAKPDMPNFQDSRRVGFSSAMLDAKKQIANFFSQSISREMSETYGTPSPEPESSTSTENPNSLKNKALRLLHAELDNQLEKRGIAKDSPEAKEEAEKLVQSSKFKDVIHSVAEAEIGSLVAQKTIEDGQNIAVVAYYSEKTKSLQAAMLGKSVAIPKGPISMPIQQYVNSLSIGDLYATHGVQLRSDENGEICVLAYGQDIGKNMSAMSSKSAKEGAELAATGNLRSYAGENVKTEGMQELTQDARQMEDLQGAVKEYTDTKSSLSRSIQTKAAALKFPGIQVIRAWNTVDTRSKKPIVGVVCVWRLSSAIKANAEREEQEQWNGSAGGAGASKLGPSTGQTAKTAQQPKKPEGYDPTQKVKDNSASGVESQDF